jgi:hypothetical protein
MAANRALDVIVVSHCNRCAITSDEYFPFGEQMDVPTG